ncbi:MAG: GNAT family N-acetyltransferase [Christensenellaceae bacterium]|jgi:hypothetical protein|nr:GNAT family N-acetyltransferase [Christensenellaceae bacterium]
MQYQIGWAGPGDIPALKALWRVCFGDPPAYIDGYFRAVFPRARAVVARCGGAPVGVIHLLPAMLRQGSTASPAYYGYAIGVLPAHRQNNLCARMHRFLYEHCDATGRGYLLHPANQRLASYYARIGLAQPCAIRRAALELAAPPLDFTCEPLTPACFAVLRSAWLQANVPAHIAYDEATLAYILAENAGNGGFAYRIILDGKDYALLGRCQGGTLALLETTLPGELLSPVAARLAHDRHAARAYALCPAGSALPGEDIAWWGLGYGPGTPKNVYLNLVMD